MIPDNVTLVVKAPNQQIDDQNIECLSSWTVRQLKGHLSEVYPSKPGTDEQKIIYSGQLLDDNTVLKDILRTYESQIVHTMHLVCTPKQKMGDTKVPEPPKIGADGLRQRNVAGNTTAATTVTSTERPETASRPEMRQNDQNHTVEMQNYLSSFVNNYGRVPPYPANYNFGEGYLPVPNDPALLANHMMMMQQAYLQYMQQYANMWQATANTAAPGAPPTAPEAPPQPAPEVPAPQPEEDEQLAARDWLDHLYAASRLAILFSLIYLYGSPARLLLVLLLAAAGYLHQIGFFRDLRVNVANNDNARRNEQQQQPNANGQAENRPADNMQAENRPPENQPAEDRPAENRAGDNVTNTDNVNNDNQLTLLASTWMIVTSFFASLIPDTN